MKYESILRVEVKHNANKELNRQDIGHDRAIILEYFKCANDFFLFSLFSF